MKFKDDLNVLEMIQKGLNDNFDNLQEWLKDIETHKNINKWDIVLSILDKLETQSFAFLGYVRDFKKDLEDFKK